MRLVLIAGDFFGMHAAGDKRQAQQGIKDTGATSPELMDECGGATRVKIPIKIE